MKKIIILLLLALCCTLQTVAQVGIGTNTPNENAALELSSTSQGMLFPRMNSTQRDAIDSPAKGLTIFNTTLNCIQTNIGTADSPSWKCLGYSPSSKGTAIVSSYTCSTASAGTMIVGTAVSGVSQTITATVTTVGTYSITATANGVTFAASGTFADTGAQNIVLTASGTPIAIGENTFTLNTTPNCYFSRTTTVQPSSNGTAVVSAYSCSTASAGTMIVGTAVSGVSQTITATVTTVGTYSISTTANGVTFSASGTFSGTGAQNIVLTASGTPTAIGTNSYTLNTTPNCSFSRYASVTGYYANVGGTIKDFMAYNIGVTGSQDPMTYQSGNNNGALYQWGRTTDGHEARTSGTAAGPISSPWTSTNFITNSSSPYDWRTPQSNTLWGDGTAGADPVKAANDPCPTGFKVPSQAQWGGLFRTGGTTGGAPSTATQNTWTWTGNGYTIGSNLYLPAAGFHDLINASLGSVGSGGYYWSSTVNGTVSYFLIFGSGDVNPGGFDARGRGHSVRCIAVDNPSSNGTAVVSAFTCSTDSAGTMIVGTAVSGVSQTITATVTTVGTYSITATANGVTFAASGTFADTGAQNIVLTASGTPIAIGENTFTLNTTPNCYFSRTTTVQPSSNGTAVVSAYSCSTASAGTMIVGTAVSGVSQTITATVTTVGTYSISTTANGVTFSASGTFSGTGAQNIVLTASGTPTAIGTNSYTLNTTPNCSFSRYASVTGYYANVGGTIKDFMAYNIGVTGSQDPMTYQSGNNNGALYQWGRTTDGHEARTSGTAAGPISSPWTSTNFITNSSSPYDWRTPQSNTLWGDGTAGADPVKAANDPCPTGFKVPSQAQWGGLFRTGGTTGGAPSTATQNTWTWTGNGYTIGSNLYLPAAGFHDLINASLGSVGSGGYYWSSTVNGTVSYFLIFGSGDVNPGGFDARGRGHSVRCIAE